MTLPEFAPSESWTEAARSEPVVTGRAALALAGVLSEEDRSGALERRIGAKGTHEAIYDVGEGVRVRVALHLNADGELQRCDLLELLRG